MSRKTSYFTAVAFVLGSIWTAGCATRGFVRSKVQPVSTKVDQVSQQTEQQGTQIKQTNDQLKQTNQQVQQNQSDISATKEIASGADSRAGDALRQAGLNSTQIGQLHNVIANLEDYKVTDQAAVHFGFNKDTLTPEDKQQLDQMASTVANLPRYFITVEGFTDQTGAASYNEELSRRRANHVIEYLVGQHNIPIYRIHMVGLGEQQLVDGGKTRAARAQSRRVQLAIFSASPLPAATTPGTR